MKKKMVCLLFAVMFVVTGCGDLEIKYFTRINPDGSIFKRIVACGDSSRVYNNPFPFQLTKDWTVSYESKVDTVKGDTLFIASAERTFSSWQKAKGIIYRQEDTLDCENIDIEYGKIFRWFFTYHTYKEIFLQRFPFRHLSIDDYLSPDQYSYLIKDDTTVVADLSAEDRKVFDMEGEERFIEFLGNSLSQEFQRLLDDYATENKLPRISEMQINQLKDYILTSTDGALEIGLLCGKTDQIIGASWPSQAYELGYFEEFNHSLDKVLVIGNGRRVEAEIEVPGLVFDTNAHQIDGNVVKWKFRDNEFQYKDYALEVRYRTINLWAILISLIIMLILLGLIFKRK